MFALNNIDRHESKFNRKVVTEVKLYSAKDKSKDEEEQASQSREEDKEGFAEAIGCPK